ncbi:hypothetical protein EAH75_02040 [Rhodanobacter glycinis]|nr:hypothetical protein EAH75_02040 [Rhodanobacter glycinis]
MFVSLMLMFSIFITGSVSATPNISGDVRGVTFFYLDGVAEDFPWVLANQYDPAIRAKIDALLTQYRSAGVNWIRLLVAYNHFPNRSEVEPVPSATLIREVNDFMAITRSGSNAGAFTIELVLVTQTDSNGLFTDVSPYLHDKLWYKTWIDNLNYTNLGMIMLGGDLSPCYLSGCEGDKVAVQPLPMNHGAWIKSIWAWKQSYAPFLNASYEVIGVQGNSNNNPLLISKLATWMNANTPSNPIVAAALYVSLPSGSTWQSYATATNAILDSYASVSSKALWIDEYGMSFGTNWTVQDQVAAYQGFLGASVCMRQKRYSKFAWVAGNDYPYTGSNWYGLVASFNGTTPAMQPAWSDLSLYYNLQTCP